MKIFLCLMIIMLLAIYSFSIDALEQNSPSDLSLKEDIPDSLAVYIPDTIKRMLLRQDTIKVMFDAGGSLALYFDCANLKIIKEKNYFAALKDDKHISGMKSMIAAEEYYSEFMCRKKTPAAVLSLISTHHMETGEIVFIRPKKPNIVKVEFGNRFILYWDCANDEIMEDENFFSILQNKENIYSMASFITDEEIICDQVCGKIEVSKKRPSVLRKGDIAYLFLSEYYNKLIDSVECLGRSFDRKHVECRHSYVLDYIEMNRNLVFQKVKSCLDETRPLPENDK